MDGHLLEKNSMGSINKNNESNRFRSGIKFN